MELSLGVLAQLTNVNRSELASLLDRSAGYVAAHLEDSVSGSIAKLPIISRMKKLARWTSEGGGPLQDIGYDEQKQKRQMQDLLNRRLMEVFVHDSGLHGKVVVLGGLKLVQAVYPYLLMDIAEEVAVCENNRAKARFLLESPILQAETRIKVCRINLFKKISLALEQEPVRWRGFDIDLDAAWTLDLDGKLREILLKTQAPAIWLRIAVTTRPLGWDTTMSRPQHFLKFISDLRCWDVQDFCTGPSFTYNDTASMAVTQVILTRR